MSRDAPFITYWAAQTQLESQKLSWRIRATLHARNFSQGGQRTGGPRGFLMFEPRQRRTETAQSCLIAALEKNQILDLADLPSSSPPCEISLSRDGSVRNESAGRCVSGSARPH